MLQDLFFYFPQLIIGTLVGIATSMIGIFVSLRKTIFLGITLSQAITVSVIVSFLIDFHYEGFIHIFSVLIFLPIYFLHYKVDFKESILASGLVFYSALGQILTALGANVQNHIVIAYFGNILFVSSDEWVHIIIPLIVSFIFLFIFYKGIMATSYDFDYAKIINMKVVWVEVIYFMILTAILSISIYFMGSFYTIAHMVIPSLIALQITKTMTSSFITAVFISAISTFLGFILSLLKIEILGNTITLPTSSTIILVMTFFLFLLILRKTNS